MPIEPVQQIWFLLSWLIILKFLQVSVGSVLRRSFPEYSGFLSYPLSILLFALLSLYLAICSLPIPLAVVPFVIILLLLIWQGDIRKADLIGDIRVDAVFLIFFLFTLELRLINPVISHFSEQFMDHAFLASLIRQPMIPPLDPWFSGGDLSMYYYGGHFLFAMLSLVSHVPSTISFNLILPTVSGLAAVSIYGIGRLFLPRFSAIPLISLVFIQPAIIWYLAGGLDIWHALNNTRWIIPGCITEYPLFSFILGDIHTHVLGLWNQCFLIALLLISLTTWYHAEIKTRLLLTGMSAVSLGFMVGCNSWDLLVYGPLVILTGIGIAYQSAKEPILTRVLYVLGTPAGALLLWSPFLLTMKTGAFTGIKSLTTPMDPGTMLLYAGFFLVVFLLYYRAEFQHSPYLLVIPILILALGKQTTAILSLPSVCLLSHVIRLREKPLEVFPAMLGLVGFGVLIFCSLFQIGLDSDPTPLNTVFKLGYAAWILLSIGALLCVGTWVNNHIRTLSPVMVRFGTICCILCLLSAPIIAQPDLGKSLFGLVYPGGYNTLDGIAYLEYSYPDDWNAIGYVRGLPKDSVILEGVGGDYSYAAPLSSMTGIPTVLGRYSHEFQWRGSRYGYIPQRMDDIKTMYEDPDAAVGLFKKYGVTHMYSGVLESGLYNLSLPLGNLEPVWYGNQSTLYKVINSEKRVPGTW